MEQGASVPLTGGAEVAEKFVSTPGMKEQVVNNSYEDFKYPFEIQFIDGIVDSFEEQKEQLENENDQLNKLVQFVSTSDEGCKMISEAVGKIVYNLLKKIILNNGSLHGCRYF